MMQMICPSDRKSINTKPALNRAVIKKIIMTKKTAITELFEKYGHLLPDVESEFKEIYKQQIIEAHKKGQLWNKSGYSPDECEQYYTETYKQ